MRLGLGLGLTAVRRVASGPQLALIDRTAGTIIGNMSAAGGLAAAFDGNTSQIATACAANLSAAAGYCGKTLAVPSTIGRAVLYPSSNLGFRSGAGDTQARLFAKQGAAPTNATDGTLLADSGIFTDAVMTLILDSDDLVTVWNHAWATLSVATGSDNFRLAELELYSWDIP